MAVLINGNGYKPVTAQQDAALYAGLVGNPPAVLDVFRRMGAQVIDNNTVRINSGEYVSQGRRIHIAYGEFDDFEIPTGTAGVVSYYIIGYRFYVDTETGNELIEQFVRKMNNATEIIEEGQIWAGADECYFSFYRVVVDGLTITGTKALFEIAKNTYMLGYRMGEAEANIAALQDQFVTQTYDFGAISYAADSSRQPGNVDKVLNTSIAKEGYTPVSARVRYSNTTQVSLETYFDPTGTVLLLQVIRTQSSFTGVTQHALVDVLYKKN